MESNIYPRKKTPVIRIEYNPETFNEISNDINEFAERYQMKVSIAYAVNAAISQYTSLLHQLTEGYRAQPEESDAELFNKLIQGLPRVKKDGMVPLQVRITDTVNDNLIAAIEEFTTMSGQKLAKFAAIRAAITIYTAKLRQLCSQHKYGRSFDDEKITKTIMP